MDRVYFSTKLKVFMQGIFCRTRLFVVARLGSMPQPTNYGPRPKLSTSIGTVSRPQQFLSTVSNRSRLHDAINGNRVEASRSCVSQSEMPSHEFIIGRFMRITRLLCCARAISAWRFKPPLFWFQDTADCSRKSVTDAANKERNYKVPST